MKKAKFNRIAFTEENVRSYEDKRKRCFRIVAEYKDETGCLYRRKFEYKKSEDLTKVKLPQFIDVI